MRISHSKSGIHLQFTEAERQLLGERVELSFSPKEKDAFLLLRPVLAGGRALCKNSGSRRTLPWRVQWENLPEMKAIPYFGCENVELVSRDTGFVALRPSMTEAPLERCRAPKRVTSKRDSIADPAAALGGLEDLVDDINDCKRRLGNNLVLEVTQDGFLRTLVQFGRR